MTSDLIQNYRPDAIKLDPMITGGVVMIKDISLPVAIALELKRIIVPLFS
jgi:hypothetical protein